MPARRPALTYNQAFLRHASCYLALAEEAEAHLTGSDQQTWLSELDSNNANLRAALQWCKMQRNAALGFRLALALCPYWETRGYWKEARGWLDTKAYEGVSVERPLFARVLNEGGIFARMECDWQSAVWHFSQAFSICEDTRDLKGQAISLNGLGAVALLTGDQAGAKAYFTQALALQRVRGDAGSIAKALHNMAIVAFDEREYAAAADMQEESLALRREIGDNREIATGLNNLGNTRFCQGELEKAKAHFEESFEINKELGYKSGLLDNYINLATLERKLGNYPKASRHLSACLVLCQEINDFTGLVSAFGGLAEIVGDQGFSEHAVALYAASAVLREKHHLFLPPAEQAEIAQTIADTNAILGEQAFTEAWKRGQAMSLKEAIRYALTTAK